MKLAVLTALRAARRGGRPVVLATWLKGGEQKILVTAEARGEGEASGEERGEAVGEQSGALSEAVARVLRSDQAEVVERDGAAVLLEPNNPPLRMILVGAVHIAHPLAEMARLAGFAVTVVDPRRAFATAERFPREVLVGSWPDEALAALAPDARTAVVTLTHDPKLDDPALEVALRTAAFYIGCLGSRKTHAGRLERLSARGCSAEALGRLRGPVGLPIGAKSPAEIAVAILAEVIAALRGDRSSASGPSGPSRASGASERGGR